MKPRCLIAIAVLMFLAVGMAQTRRATFFSPQVVAVAAPYSPTNISGVTNLSWWVADGQIETNASGLLSNWFDAGVSPKTLTNRGLTTTWPLVTNNAVNGHTSILFDGGDNMNSLVYTSSQPHTTFMVMRYNDTTNAANKSILDSRAAPTYLFYQGTGKLVVNAGTSQTFEGLRTNAWITLEFVATGAGSGVLMNNVSMSGTKNIGANALNGFTLGAASGLNGNSKIEVAEMLTYFGTLGTVDATGVYSVATARSNLYVYLTNKYAITQ